MESVLKQRGMDYRINEADGAFYGPKIDFHILDSLGRSWQCGTVQLDFQMPEKFNCRYVNELNELEYPIIIHRAIFGSVERFLAILLEHYAGDFPVWLAPEQVRIVPIADQHVDYANDLRHRLAKEGIRVKVDDRAEKMGLKIRESEKQKVPYMLVVGDQEVEKQLVSVRKRKEGDLGQMPMDKLLEKVQSEQKK